MPFADTKSIFESRTFWVNFLTTVAGVITYLAGEAWIKEIPGGEATLLVVLGLVNVALRFITVDAVRILAVLLAVGLAISASPAHAAEPQQSFITKAQYEANVLPWGVGTNFVKDQENRFWIIHKHMPPMQARVDGTPIFPLDEQMWHGVMLEHAKKKAKPVAPVAKPAIKLGGDWADGFDGLISVIEQAKGAAANGDPSLLADVRASLIANRAALNPAAKQEAILTPAQARWFQAMPLPWIERRVIAVILGL